MGSLHLVSSSSYLRFDSRRVFDLATLLSLSASLSPWEPLSVSESSPQPSHLLLDLPISALAWELPLARGSTVSSLEVSTSVSPFLCVSRGNDVDLALSSTAGLWSGMASFLSIAAQLVLGMIVAEPSAWQITVAMLILQAVTLAVSIFGRRVLPYLSTGGRESCSSLPFLPLPADLVVPFPRRSHLDRWRTRRDRRNSPCEGWRSISPIRRGVCLCESHRVVGRDRSLHRNAARRLLVRDLAIRLALSRLILVSSLPSFLLLLLLSLKVRSRRYRYPSRRRYEEPWA